MKRRRPGVRPHHERDQARNTIYGVLPVLEALRAGRRRFERVVIADGAREKRLEEIVGLCGERRVPVVRMNREQIASLVKEGVNHQGIVGFADAPSYADADALLDGRIASLLVVLDGVEDPQNLGAILRVAECAGADGVVIPDRRSAGLTEAVAKASAGAVEHIGVARVANLNRFIEELKSRNVWVVGASADAEMAHTDWDWTRSSALVMGGEGKGLHRLVAENCDVLVKIPIYGRIDSLNVSVACGVILFEARRQRAVNSEQ